MLHVVLGGGSRIGRAVRRLTSVVIVLLCAIVLSALVLPTKAEAKRLNVKFVIDNIDDYPDMRNKDFTYICSFYHWEDYAQGGWRLSQVTGQWEWQDFDDYFGKDRAVSGPNDKAPGYWYNLNGIEKAITHFTAIPAWTVPDFRGWKQKSLLFLPLDWSRFYSH